ncbi:hypothetical protein GCM10027575_48980 [Phytohabitans suffuscus]
MLVQVNLRVNGAPARIQIAGRAARQAITVAASRLERQVARLTAAWQPWPWPDPDKRSLGTTVAAGSENVPAGLVWLVLLLALTAGGEGHGQKRSAEHDDRRGTAGLATPRVRFTVRWPPRGRGWAGGWRSGTAAGR